MHLENSPGFPNPNVRWGLSPTLLKNLQDSPQSQLTHGTQFFITNERRCHRQNSHDCINFNISSVQKNQMSLTRPQFVWSWFDESIFKPKFQAILVHNQHEDWKCINLDHLRHSLFYIILPQPNLQPTKLSKDKICPFSVHFSKWNDLWCFQSFNLTWRHNDTKVLLHGCLNQGNQKLHFFIGKKGIVPSRLHVVLQ